jgi:uncharacterized protein (DUF1786 family)
MSKYLILDIGAGTLDILYYDAASGLHYKTVARSPVLSLAERAAGLPGNLLITGVEMGGGSLSKVLRRRVRDTEVVMSASAAATVHHNRDRVKSWGIKVVEDSEAEDLRKKKDYAHLNIADLETDRLRHVIRGLGVPFSFDVVGICAQDHGVPPEGMSHLDYRHNIFKETLDRTPFPHALLYRHDEIPATFNRLLSIAKTARTLPCHEIYVMDSGMAAILGASLDPRARLKERILVLDIATSHTVGAAMEKGEVAGFFEYHTQDITPERLETLLVDLAEGKLEHRRILEEKGHGAYVRKAFGFDAAEIIIATGPRRSLLEDTTLPIVPGAPLGDNMMTGTVGVLEAIGLRKGLEPLSRHG